MSENTAVVTKKEPGMASLVIVLFAISAITALVLGLVNMVTAPQIAINTQKKTDEAKAAVLASEVYEDVAYAGADTTIKNIWKAGDAGYVVEVTPSGFGGNLDVMVGVDNDGVCTGVSIVSHAETSGLGANATKEAWQRTVHRQVWYAGRHQGRRRDRGSHRRHHHLPRGHQRR